MITLAILVVASIVSAYWFWVRPILRRRPSLQQVYADADSFWEAVRLKFAGLKQKFASAVVVAASIAVTMYDFAAPIVSQIDPTAIGPITDRVPSWAWPLVMIAITGLFQWLRNLGDRRNAAEKKEIAAELQAKGIGEG